MCYIKYANFKEKLREISLVDLFGRWHTLSSLFQRNGIHNCHTLAGCPWHKVLCSSFATKFDLYKLSVCVWTVFFSIQMQNVSITVKKIFMANFWISGWNVTPCSFWERSFSIISMWSCAAFIMIQIWLGILCVFLSAFMPQDLVNHWAN